jgi:hypothetical protein
MKYSISVPARLAVALTVATILGGNAPLAHGAEPWTTVASAGTMDEETEGMLQFNQGWTSFDAAIETGPAILRYNVVAVDGLFGGDGTTLSVSYFSQSANDRVTVILWEQDLRNGARTERIRLDSQSYPTSLSRQFRTTSQCFTSFDFENKAYYVEAWLRKPAGTVGPGLGAIKIGRNTCIL